MKYIRMLTAVILIISMLVSFSGCAGGETGEDIKNQTDTADSSETDEASADFTYSVDADTTVSLFFKKGETGYAEKFRVVSPGHADSQVDLTLVSERVLMNESGVVFTNADECIKTLDLNCDGHEDLLIKAWNDSSYTPYYSFFWNSEEASYVYVGVLGDPYVDISTGKILSNVVCDGVETIYVYKVIENSINQTDVWIPPTEVPEFRSDIAAYEQYMAPEQDDGYLILVNDDNRLDETYVPEDLYNLVDTRFDGRETQQMRLTAAMAMEAMFIEMRALGYNDMSITSAYRDYYYQDQLFNSYVEQEMNEKGVSREEAEKYASVYSAEAGTSEHQTGLCCDMHNLGEADISFADERVFAWLEANAWKFGFVLRFPENKVKITGIQFEPWHFRYVGRANAQKMKALDMCLEEYVSFVNATQK